MRDAYAKIISLVAIMLLIATGGCRKAYINGKLDGQWQVLSITYTDGTTETPDRTYYRINLHSVELYSPSGGTTNGNMTYDREASTLLFEFPRATEKFLSRYGILQSPVKFEILDLTSKRLVLKSADAEITLRKF